MREKANSGKLKINQKTKHAVIAYFFLLPALVILIIFTYYPIVYGVVLGFYDYNMIKTLDNGDLAPPVFVGIKNFLKIFKDPYFYTALKNSFLYLIVVPFIQLLSILIAMAMNSNIRGKTFFRTAYYIPVITSIVVVGIVWQWIFATDGAMNFILNKFLQIIPFVHAGNISIHWLTDKNIALFSVMFVTLWQGLGYYMVLYLAGLQSINPEFEEAAKIDGASRFQVFRSITLPLLKPSIALCAIISCISALKVFGEIYVMTQGGPEHGTLTMVYYIFGKAFNEFNMGYASALSLVLAVFVGIISYINIRFFREGGLKYY